MDWCISKQIVQYTCADKVFLVVPDCGEIPVPKGQ